MDVGKSISGRIQRVSGSISGGLFKQAEYSICEDREYNRGKGGERVLVEMRT